MNVRAWIQHNIVAIIVAIASATSVYASMASTQAVARAEISALQQKVQIHEEVISEIPALKRDIQYVSDEVSDIKPLMKELSDGVNDLNVTLARLEGKLDLDDDH